MPQNGTFGQARAEVILRERMKELNCLHSIAKMIPRMELSLEDCLQAVVEALPNACLYPEIACARIRFRKIEYQTPGFQETPWMIGAELRVHGQCAGSVEVFYTAERPSQHEGPFLAEERLLVDTAATYLGLAIESRLLRTELERYRNT